MDVLKYFVSFGIPIITLLMGIYIGVQQAKRYKQSFKLQEQSSDNEAEELAYKRVGFFKSELDKVKADLEQACKDIKVLENRLNESDDKLIEAERIKNLALSKANEYMQERDVLQRKLDEATKQINQLSIMQGDK